MFIKLLEMVIVTLDVFHMHCQEKKTTMIQFKMFVWLHIMVPW